MASFALGNQTLVTQFCYMHHFRTNRMYPRRLKQRGSTTVYKIWDWIARTEGHWLPEALYFDLHRSMHKIRNLWKFLGCSLVKKKRMKTGLRPLWCFDVLSVWGEDTPTFKTRRSLSDVFLMQFTNARVPVWKCSTETGSVIGNSCKLTFVLAQTRSLKNWSITVYVSLPVSILGSSTYQESKYQGFPGLR